MNTTNLPKPPRPRYPWRILLLAAVTLPLLAAGGWVGICLIDRLRASWEVQAIVAELDRDDPGWTLEEIIARRTPIPDTQNGALRFAAIPAFIPRIPVPGTPILELDPDDPDFPEQERLRQQMKDAEGFWESTYDLEPCMAYNTRQLDYLREWHQKTEAALAKAILLADYPHGQFPLDDATSPGDCSRVVSLLKDGACVLAHDKDLRGACRYVRAMLHLGNYSLVQSDIVFYRWWHVDSLRRGVWSLERILGQAQLDPADLLDLRRLLEASERQEPAALRSALCRERASNHRTLQSEADDRAESATARPAPWWDRVPSWDGMNDYLLETPRRRHAHAEYLRLITEWIKACDLPWDELVKLEQKHDQYLGSNKRVAGATSLLQSVPSAAHASFRLRAYLRCACVALAVERYRQEKGEWPATLDALVPGSLVRVPADPYDGKPLRLKRLSDGVVVYSVGPDLTDNGGKLDRQDLSVPGRDIGFQLWDIDKRGRTAPAT